MIVRDWRVLILPVAVQDGAPPKNQILMSDIPAL